MTEFEVANPLLKFLVAWTLRWCNDRLSFLVQNIIFHINQAVDNSCAPAGSIRLASGRHLVPKQLPIGLDEHNIGRCQWHCG